MGSQRSLNMLGLGTMFAQCLDVSGNILAILVSPRKVPFEVEDGHIKFPVTLGIRWKRALLVALALAGLFFLAEVGSGNSAISRLGIAAMVAALKDPLTVFNERSPGKRSGALLSIKKGVPHERVLSTVRERPSPPGTPVGIPPGVDNPVFGAAPAALIPGIPPAVPGDRVFGSPNFAPFFPGAVGVLPGEQVPPPIIPITQPGLEIPPDSIPLGTTPPGIVPPGETSPEQPSIPPGITPPSEPPEIIVLPEPGTWGMMILGLLVIGMATRRRARNGADK